MSLVKIFQDINSQYEYQKNTMRFGIKNNIFHQNLEGYIKEAIPVSILGKNYIPYLSVGKGNWANVPWIAVFDQNITTTAQKGFYIVYLFSEDYKKVYLSLNQGWNYFIKNGPLKQAKAEAETVAEFWRNNLELIEENKSFNKDEIDLSNQSGSTSTRGRGYGYANIISKCYIIEDLGESDEQMLHGDLNDMITVLKELKSKLVKAPDPVAETIKSILDGQELSDIAKKNEIKKITENEQKKRLVLTDKEFEPSSKSSNSFNDGKSGKKDYLAATKTNQKTGREGERLVLDYEKNRLLINPLLSAHSDKVEWVADTQGDGLGYDIVSYDIDSGGVVSEIYIEVKTTTGSIDTPIYISANEYNIALQKGDQYYIYRVFNYKKDPELKIIKNPLDSIADQQVVNYRLTFKESNG